MAIQRLAAEGVAPPTAMRARNEAQLTDKDLGDKVFPHFIGNVCRPASRDWSSPPFWPLP